MTDLRQGHVQEAACSHAQDWAGLYRRDYDLATLESIKHPAKASWDLAFRILEHLEELGLADPETSTVLDPCSGAASTGIAASRLGLNYIGIELSEAYNALAHERLKAEGPMWSEA